MIVKSIVVFYTITGENFRYGVHMRRNGQYIFVLLRLTTTTDCFDGI